MPYTEEEMYEIERDPVRLRGYFWRVGMNARRIALENRAKSKAMGMYSPVTNYKYAYHDGKDLLADAEHMDRFSKVVLKHIDALVESCLIREDK